MQMFLSHWGTPFPVDTRFLSSNRYQFLRSNTRKFLKTTNRFHTGITFDSKGLIVTNAAIERTRLTTIPTN